MGGFGSGQWQTGKTTTDASKSLDIRFMRKNGWLVPGRMGSLSWSSRGKSTGSISYTVHDDKLELNYNYSSNGGESTPITQNVYLEKTHCNYGGERLWLQCPHCGSRRDVLYLHGYHFTCRKCADLTYNCQQEQTIDRNYRRARKIRHKLVTDVWKGTHLEFNPDNLSHKPIFKPKGMHQKTFDRLVYQQNFKINAGINIGSYWGKCTRVIRTAWGV